MRSKILQSLLPGVYPERSRGAFILLPFAFCLLPYLTFTQIIHVNPGESIQEAINSADTGDTLLVSDGTYYENIQFMGKAITVASQYIIDGDTSHITNTIIDGSQPAHPDSAAVVMFVNNEDTTSIINGFTITGGSGVLWNEQVDYGGGIFVNNAGAKILNNIIIDNHVMNNQQAAGGGIACRRGEGDVWVVIRHNRITNNTSTVNPTTSSSAYGGGIYSNASAIITNNTIKNNSCINTGTITDAYADGGGIEIEHLLGSDPATVAEISNNTISNNTIEGYKSFGGGVMVYYASVHITNNTIRNNSVTAIRNGDGGGIHIRNALNTIRINNNDISENMITAGNYGRGGGIVYWNPSAELILVGNTINDNHTDAVECRGSGVLFRNPVGRITVTDNKFIGNDGNLEANTYNGGGVCLNDAYDSLVIFNRNRFEDNSAILGGGLFVRRSFNLKITNNLIISNTTVNGGGVYMYHPEGDDKRALRPQIVNNTICDNYSNYGGGFFMNCETNHPVIFNNIFWENQSPNYDDIFYISGTDSILISHCNINANEIYGNWKGKANINDDPEFTDELCHLIGPASPCADGGTEYVHHNGTTYYAPDDDYDGEVRPYNDGLYDIGADETYIWVGISPHNRSSENAFILNQNYPNPFSNTTNISFTLIKAQDMRLEVYDCQGRKIEEPVNQHMIAGDHQVIWNVAGFSSGIYYYRITAGDQSKVRKMIIQ